MQGLAFDSLKRSSCSLARCFVQRPGIDNARQRQVSPLRGPFAGPGLYSGLLYRDRAPLRLDQYPGHGDLRQGAGAVRKGDRGCLRRAHRGRAEADGRLRQADRSLQHGREGRHRSRIDRAGLQSRPLPAVVGDGTAADVPELGGRHRSDDGAPQGRAARQGLRIGQGAGPLRAAAVSDLDDRQEDSDRARLPRPAAAHAEHDGRRGAGEARRDPARHSAQPARRHPRQRLCGRDRLWLGLGDDGEGVTAARC